MKRKYIDRRDWKRIIQGRRVLFNTYEKRFDGYGSALFIDKISEKLLCTMEEREFCLVDEGYIWIQRLPIHKHWSVTTMFNEEEEIIQWYFDITKQNSISSDGRPFYDDLYLDVVVLPSGEIYLLDEDELKEALDCDDITKEDFELAYREADIIMNGLAMDIGLLSKTSYGDLKCFKNKLKK